MVPVFSLSSVTAEKWQQRVPGRSGTHLAFPPLAFRVCISPPSSAFDSPPAAPTPAVPRQAAGAAWARGHRWRAGGVPVAGSGRQGGRSRQWKRPFDFPILLLDSIDAVMRFATTMTWQGKRPVVELVTTTYQTGVKLMKDAMQTVETQLQRLPGLDKWFVDIVPTSSAILAT